MDEDDEKFNFDMFMYEPKSNGGEAKAKSMNSKLKSTNAILKAKSLFKGNKMKKKKILSLKKVMAKREKDALKDDSTEGKTYPCRHPLCDKVFNDKNSYRKHLIIHGEKQFVCQAENCGKKFLDNSKLKRHMIVHSGDKAYKCELCNKRFSLDFNLRTHLRIHTGEKPYVCSFEGCYKRFSQSSNLSAHEKTHLMAKAEEEELNANGKKKLFRVIRAQSVIVEEKTKKHVVILDRDKLEDKKKANEDENLTKEGSNLINKSSVPDFSTAKPFSLQNKQQEQEIKDSAELNKLLLTMDYKIEARQDELNEKYKQMCDLDQFEDFQYHLTREFALNEYKRISILNQVKSK